MSIYIAHCRKNLTLNTQTALVGSGCLRKRMSSSPVGITGKYETFLLYCVCVRRETLARRTVNCFWKCSIYWYS